MIRKTSSKRGGGEIGNDAARRKESPFQATVSASARAKFDEVCAARGMTKTGLLSKLIEWFAVLDRTSASLVLDHFERSDVVVLCELVLRRAGEQVLADLLAGELLLRRARNSQE